MAQPRNIRKAVRKPDYQAIEDLKAEISQLVAKYKTLFPAMDLGIAIKAKMLTQHGDETITVKVVGTPSSTQNLLPGMEEADLDVSYKTRLKEWQEQEKKREEEERKRREEESED
jgi:hypothetical protein